MRLNKTNIPDLSDADIRLLKVFRAVTEFKGFANAETILNIGRSTISAKMSTLEGRLGVRLCQRGPGGFKLTEEGKEVYAASTRLFMALDEFRTDVIKTHGHEYLDFGVVDNMIGDAASPVVGALSRYTQILPNVHIKIYTLPPDEIAQKVEKGRIDIGLIPLHGEIPGLVYEHIYKERNELYCGKGHPWFSDKGDGDFAEGTTVDLRYVSHGYKHTPLEQVFNFGLTDHATASSVEGIAILIMTGQFIGFLPKHFAAFWVARREMKPIRPKKYFFDANIVSIRRQESSNKSIVNELLRQLTRRC